MTISDINSFLTMMVTMIGTIMIPVTILAILGYLLKPKND